MRLFQEKIFLGQNLSVLEFTWLHKRGIIPILSSQLTFIKRLTQSVGTFQFPIIIERKSKKENRAKFKTIEPRKLSLEIKEA